MLSSLEVWGGFSGGEGSRSRGGYTNIDVTEVSPCDVDQFEARLPRPGGPSEWSALEDRVLALNDKENVIGHGFRWS